MKRWMVIVLVALLNACAGLDANTGNNRAGGGDSDDDSSTSMYGTPSN